MNRAFVALSSGASLESAVLASTAKASPPLSPEADAALQRLTAKAASAAAPPGSQAGERARVLMALSRNVPMETAVAGKW